MKRTYQLTKGKHAPARVIESIKSNVNKYVKRERRKELPDDIDFWDFDCKVGVAAETAAVVHLSAIGSAIDNAAASSKTETIYVEIETQGRQRKSSKTKTKSSEKKAPVVKAPVVEAPAVEAPAVEAPAVEVPVVEAPAVEAPAVEAPAVEAPAVEALQSSEIVANSSSPPSEGVDDPIRSDG